MIGVLVERRRILSHTRAGVAAIPRLLTRVASTKWRRLEISYRYHLVTGLRTLRDGCKSVKCLF